MESEEGESLKGKSVTLLKKKKKEEVYSVSKNQIYSRHDC